MGFGADEKYLLKLFYEKVTSSISIMHNAEIDLIIDKLNKCITDFVAIHLLLALFLYLLLI